MSEIGRNIPVDTDVPAKSNQERVGMIEDQLKSYLESKKEEKDNEASIKVRELRQQLKEELEVSKNETREELSNLFVDTIVEYVRNFVDGRKGELDFDELWSEIQFESSTGFIGERILHIHTIRSFGNILGDDIYERVKAELTAKEVVKPTTQKVEKPVQKVEEKTVEPQMPEVKKEVTPVEKYTKLLEKAEIFELSLEDFDAGLEELEAYAQGEEIKELTNEDQTKIREAFFSLLDLKADGYEYIEPRLEEVVDDDFVGPIKPEEEFTPSEIPEYIRAYGDITETETQKEPEVEAVEKTDKVAKQETKVEVTIDSEAKDKESHDNSVKEKLGEINTVITLIEGLIKAGNYAELKNGALEKAKAEYVKIPAELIQKNNELYSQEKENVPAGSDRLSMLEGLMKDLNKSYEALNSKYADAKDFYEKRKKYPENVIKAIQKEVGVTADGIFGPATFTAIMEFQKSNGLTADGLVGNGTFAKMPEAKKALEVKKNKSDDYDTEAMEDYNLGTTTDSKNYKEGEYKPAEREIKILETSTLDFSQVESGKDFINYLLDNADSFGDVIRALVTGEKEIAQFVAKNGEKIGITFEKLDDENVQISLDTPYFDGLSDSDFDTQIKLTDLPKTELSAGEVFGNDKYNILLKDQIIGLAKRYNTELEKLDQEEVKELDEKVESKEESDLISIEEAYNYVSEFEFNERDRSTYHASDAVENFENPEGDEVEVKLYKRENGEMGIYIDTPFGDGVSDMFVPVDNKDQIQGLISKSKADYLAQYDLENNHTPAPVVELDMSGADVESVSEEVAKTPTELYKELSEVKFKENGSKTKYSDVVESFENEEGDEIELKFYKKENGEMGVALDTVFGDNVSDAQFKIDKPEEIKSVLKEAKDYYNMVYKVQNR